MPATKKLPALSVAVVLALQLAAAQTKPAPASSDELAREARAALARTDGRVKLAGLRRPVEVWRDPWGVAHIYAQDADDLFFAQGFVAAQDRLWQMEMWRRAGEGRLAEILGAQAVERDKFARLMRYRGDTRAEWRSYAPDARRIIESFVRGVNAFIGSSRDHLPVEFQLTGTRPDPWTPEVCLLRLSSLEVSGNASRELQRALLVRRLGAKLADELMPTDPHKATEVPAGLDLEDLNGDILAGMRAATGAVDFRATQGSNNWVASGALTSTGKPLLANDPHRGVGLPSLRYMVHLNAPGWNVVGAGEPSLPGVAIGHNERVAFGITVVGVDQQDLYVEETDPRDSSRYRYRGAWEPMRVEREEISVRGRSAPVSVELKFTRHGAVVFEDEARHRAYALRTVSSEPGTAAYLASLSLDRARDWREFVAALARWKSPSENFVYADVDGNIGWQATGLTPIRPNWSGLLPVPGASGQYEWRGFLPASELPRSFNPREGFIATANHNILPPGYNHALNYEFSPPTRLRRIVEVLRSKQKGWTVEDFERLQHDSLSLPAREFVPRLRNVKTDDADLRRAIDLLLNWDFVLSRDSAAAALYELWFNRLSADAMRLRFAGEADADRKARDAGGRAGLVTLESWLSQPATAFGANAEAKRDELLLESLREAVADLRGRLGSDPSKWRWGSLHAAEFRHPLSTDGARRAVLDLGAVERAGDANTVMATGGGANFRQTHGASYREVLDVSDWDGSVAINVPGQSAQPSSPHYGDLLPLWAEGRYFPLLFTRAAVERRARERLILEPAGR
ncbi:MAG: penicillin acylase family protein [Acidobacteria bacterium]|nr:penicillin acylase family protein [Acidobacteriota bacterium]